MQCFVTVYTLSTKPCSSLYLFFIFFYLCDGKRIVSAVSSLLRSSGFWSLSKPENALPWTRPTNQPSQRWCCQIQNEFALITSGHEPQVVRVSLYSWLFQSSQLKDNRRISQTVQTIHPRVPRPPLKRKPSRRRGCQLQGSVCSN